MSHYEWRDDSVTTITDDDIFQVSSKPSQIFSSTNL